MLRAEYLWLDSNKPAQIRSKVKYLNKERLLNSNKELTLDAHLYPEWTFDGSSTNQAEGHDSDCILQPVRVVEDPLHSFGVLVLCEVFNADSTVHKSNTRHALIIEHNRTYDSHNPFMGFEQEYVIMKDGRPLGFPEEGFPAPQGPYYCGNGGDKVKGRELVERHANACLDAGLSLYGTNAEVLLGQWEFQIGPNHKTEVVTPLHAADDLWLARFLLERLAEGYGYSISYDCKPVEGDWNGSGMHTNVSTKQMRNKGGIREINKAIKKLSKKHKEHIAVYGVGLEKRLTGKHETCNINEFKSGTANRGASVRIPVHVKTQGYGYLEDRRPGSNADPYLVARVLLETICG